MSEITAYEIKSMTKEQNYLRGYTDGKSDVLEDIREDIEEYGSICVAYAITDKTKTDEGIEKLVTDVLSEAKRQVIEIIDKYKEGSEK